MEIAAVYLQAVMMEPNMPMVHAPGDIHLEADISATKGYKHGFEEGDWIPYLEISYHIRKKGSDWSAVGSFKPMIASDGPHYGDNIKLNGPGAYDVTYHIASPMENGFLRHVDKETGTASWWQPFDAQYSFKYIGTGKKGGY
jgi:uncharacterized protein involved in high-affinity Fe2+ transport